MIIRKLVTTVTTCVLVMLIYFFEGQTAFAIVVVLYLFPILLIYEFTKKLRGLSRRSCALLIHLFLGALFVVIPILLTGWERKFLLSDIKSLFSNFYFITSLLSSCLFYCLDEFLRSKLAKCLYKRAKALFEKIGDMRI
ncbi:hypothetical protein SAMN05421832_10974 [Psychrobacillus psychrodurans]|nr:hypothetical protein SAMN05421832_10974 [Psychrobacillus psychrodurans]